MSSDPEAPVGVLLLTHGGPREEGEIAPFIEALLSDPYMVDLPGWPRGLLARTVASKRAPKVAEHYRMANAEIDERRDELERLRSQLAEEHRNLVLKKQELDEWAGRYRQEVDEQAQRLLAREQELERQETVFNDLARQWQAEQIGYEQEIRRLRARLREPEAALAVA